MTYGIKNIVAGLARSDGDTEKRKGFFGTKRPLWGCEWDEKKLCRAVIERDNPNPKAQEWTLADVYTYAWGAHCGHALEFCVALLCYWLFYSDGSWMQEAKEWHIGWVSRIFLFNLCCELVFVNFWHYWSYASTFYDVWLKGGMKYNPENQYEPDQDGEESYTWNGMFTSSTGQLEREITFTTLGWLQSAGWQCLFTHLWACEIIPCYVNFWAYPFYSVLVLMAMTYWREVHFYCAHRGMHPWWDRNNGLLNGDVGAFLYRHVHSLHHKSFNPGPWSGLCMHPVEHFLYYSCATLPPLILSVHPIHFLYTKFHADIAPIGGHDGMDEPGGKGDFHWLHHAKFECNYGVPFPINLDLLLGTWADFEVWKATGKLTVSSKAEKLMNEAEEKEKTDEKQVPLLSDENAEVKDNPAASKEFTMEDISKHRKRGDCWVALYGVVLDVSDFLDQHPGGAGLLLAMSGKDITEKFETIHASSGGFALVAKWPKIAEIGVLSNYDGPAPPKPEEEGSAPLKWPGALFFFPVLAVVAITAIASANFS
jgi:cytochrome b involved in lipid metabolism